MLSSTQLIQLLAHAKQNDETALAAIITHKMPMIRRFAAAAAMPGLDFDDAVQEGLIGLFHAIEGYDENNLAGASFDTYATACIQNSIRSAQKAAGRKKHAPLNQSVPLSEHESIPGPEELAVQSEQVDIMLERARARLSPLEKRVLSLYLQGLSYLQIARRLGKSPKAVDNALARIRRKLK